MQKNTEFTTSNFKETQNLGKKIAKCLKAPAVILLYGDLAAGKTTFTQGLAKGLGINTVVNSPSFTIMRSYETKSGMPFNHLDLYRLNGVGADFDLQDYIDQGICVIEWPGQATDLLPKNRIEISIEKHGENSRVFQIEEVGESMMLDFAKLTKGENKWN